MNYSGARSRHDELRLVEREADPHHVVAARPGDQTLWQRQYFHQKPGQGRKTSARYS